MSAKPQVRGYNIDHVRSCIKSGELIEDCKLCQRTIQQYAVLPMGTLSTVLQNPQAETLKASMAAHLIESVLDRAHGKYDLKSKRQKGSIFSTMAVLQAYEARGGKA